mmetsp:Transcript_16683/g.54523  ORF Transcript_16683/g.54523 Transcript_16683/m.54523 type:complete len:233 (-) Transcript_16683:2332-3030(-)
MNTSALDLTVKSAGASKTELAAETKPTPESAARRGDTAPVASSGHAAPSPARHPPLVESADPGVQLALNPLTLVPSPSLSAKYAATFSKLGKPGQNLLASMSESATGSVYSVSSSMYPIKLSPIVSGWKYEFTLSGLGTSKATEATSTKSIASVSLSSEYTTAMWYQVSGGITASGKVYSTARSSPSPTYISARSTPRGVSLTEYVFVYASASAAAPLSTKKTSSRLFVARG